MILSFSGYQEALKEQKHKGEKRRVTWLKRSSLKHKAIG
jgi:hypothetical protein